MNKKVLVIHPKDESTDFLKYVYKDRNYDVITDCCISRNDLIKQIESHDKIIMMGHGTPSGLMNPEYFSFAWPKRGDLRPFIIDQKFIPLLKQKETISIWCNSDGFFKPAGIKGFHTGMIISETSEQQYVLGKVVLDKKAQLYNMLNFANIVGQCIDKSPEEMKEHILSKYNYGDEVTNFNRKNIIVL